MTKKDYVLIADSIASSCVDLGIDPSTDTLRNLIYDLSDALSKDNAMFDRRRFIEYILDKFNEAIRERHPRLLN